MNIHPPINALVSALRLSLDLCLYLTARRVEIFFLLKTVIGLGALGETKYTISCRIIIIITQPRRVSFKYPNTLVNYFNDLLESTCCSYHIVGEHYICPKL